MIHREACIILKKKCDGSFLPYRPALLFIASLPLRAAEYDHQPTLWFALAPLLRPSNDRHMLTSVSTLYKKLNQLSRRTCRGTAKLLLLHYP